MSGETWRPKTSRSSPTFPITVTPVGSTASSRPCTNRAPPTPPLRTVTFTFRPVMPPSFSSRAKRGNLTEGLKLEEDPQRASAACPRPSECRRVQLRDLHPELLRVRPEAGGAAP